MIAARRGRGSSEGQLVPTSLYGPMDFFREAVRRKGGSQSEQAAFLGYWMRRFSVRFAAGVATVMTRRWARFSGRSYAAGELEFGAFYAETGAAPGTAPGDLQHGGV